MTSRRQRMLSESDHRVSYSRKSGASIDKWNEKKVRRSKSLDREMNTAVEFMTSTAALTDNVEKNDTDESGITFLNPNIDNGSHDSGHDSGHTNEQLENLLHTNSSSPQSYSSSPNGQAKKNVQESFMSSTRSSTVKVEIADFGDGDSINMTTFLLRKCKSQIMRPYTRLLLIISWRAFGRDSINPNQCWWRLLNVFYPTLIIALLLYTYIYEIVACQWKLDVIEDTRPYENPSTVLPANVTAKITDSTSVNMTSLRPAPLVCQHIFTTYVVPNVLHFAAFIMGFFYFRIHDNEQLYALMEKVFLQVTSLQGKAKSQTKLITKLRLFLALGGIWVLLTIGLQIMFVLVFGIDRRNALADLDTSLTWLWGLFGVQVIGIAVLNSVNLAVVLNYCAQCELLMYYVNGIFIQLQEKSVNLKTAMKDLLSVRHSIGLLNGSMSQMTSLAVVRFTELTVIGISIVFLNKDDEGKVWAYRIIFPLVWVIVVLFPLIQAARMNSVCAKFKQIALDTRIFGYQNNSQLELDSFLLFVAQTRLRVKYLIPLLLRQVLSGVTTIRICVSCAVSRQYMSVGGWKMEKLAGIHLMAMVKPVENHAFRAAFHSLMTLTRKVSVVTWFVCMTICREVLSDVLFS